jgi:hypothetical protein
MLLQADQELPLDDQPAALPTQQARTPGSVAHLRLQHQLDVLAASLLSK